MTLRPRASLLLVLLGLPLALSLTACNKVQSLSIIPGPGIEILTAAGQTAQYTAFAQEQMGSAPMTTANVTNSVTWTTSNPNIATINSSGLATAVGAGYAQITAVASDGAVAASDLMVEMGGSTTQSTPSITILPGSAGETFVGETTQFTATGNLTGIGNAQNVTNQVTWLSSNAQVATINSTGLATAVGAGTTTIVALAPSGGLNASASLSVTISGAGSGSTIASISVIPGSQAVSSPGNTSQFIAIGTTGAGATVNLTNQVAWNSSSAQIAIIGGATGFATAVGQGTATISALYANSSGGTVVAGTATFTVAGGTTEQYTAVTILPGSQALSASGQTGQFIALATLGSTGLETDVTNSPQIKWSSSIPTIATVSASGLATGVSAGTTTVMAKLTNPDGSVVSGSASIAVSLTVAPEPLLSLTIIPGSIAVGNLKGQGQFLAIGTYATAPYTRDLTNNINLVWLSSFPNDFTVSSNTGGGTGATAGVVTAYASGSATIIAEATNPLDGTIQTATATFNCPYLLPNLSGNPPTPGSCYPGSEGASLLSTLTVYNEGLNSTNPITSNWLITASSATGTANVIHCGPGWTANGKTGGSVCTAIYPIGTTVTLTAPAQAGVAFGGWSYNCAAQGAITAGGPNTCTVQMTADETVGAIFN